jgi:hypothetical protein
MPSPGQAREQVEQEADGEQQAGECHEAHDEAVLRRHDPDDRDLLGADRERVEVAGPRRDCDRRRFPRPGLEQLDSLRRPGVGLERVDVHATDHPRRLVPIPGDRPFDIAEERAPVRGVDAEGLLVVRMVRRHGLGSFVVTRHNEAATRPAVKRCGTGFCGTGSSYSSASSPSG